MNSKRVVEVFSAGCAICEETLNLVRRVACPSCEVTLRDMHDQRSHAGRRASASVRCLRSLLTAHLPRAVRDGGLMRRRYARQG